MSEPFLGEIRSFGFQFAPQGWARCDGQLLPINQHQALFSLLGTTYGGNGQTTFGLPDLRGRVPLHRGPNQPLGSSGGAETHVLTHDELPSHRHDLQVASSANQDDPVGTAPGPSDFRRVAPEDGSATLGGHIGAQGDAQAHENMQPYLTTSYCIALVGIFPSQS